VTRRVVSSFVSLAVALAGCMGGVTNPPDPYEGIGVVGQWVESDYRVRTYLMITSSRVVPGVPAPLLILFHGAGDNAAGFRTRIGALGAQDLADSNGFIVAYPDGVGHSWGAQCGCTNADAGGVDDVKFARTLIRQLIDSLDIDSTRIYVAGYSEGALLSQLLACRLADRVAGAGSIAATMSRRVAGSCAPARPVPIVFFQGTADSLFRWGGDNTFFSAAGTVAEWTARDGCSGAPAISALPDTAADGTTVSLETHTACAASAEVDLYTVTGGGHTWPGAPGSFPAFLGVVSRDISANRLLIEFFGRH